MNTAAIIHEHEEPRSFVTTIRENWAWLSGCAGVLIFLGVLWARVDSNTKSIEQQSSEVKGLVATVAETRTDVAVIRAIVEERNQRTP